MHIKTYNAFEIVKIPFPFTDKSTNKVRPALVISSIEYQKSTNHVICLMITSAKHSTWNMDVVVPYYQACGLPSPSIIRMKVFSIDSALIIDKIGVLHKDSVKQVSKALKLILHLKN